MNNKGFAITTILYGTLILFLMLFLSMLGILSSYKDRINMLVENNNGARDIINYTNIGYFDMSSVPLPSGKMTYSISNGIVTVTSSKSDGYGYIPYYVELEAGKNYVFHCDTNGIWNSGTDSVEAFLMLDGKHVSFTTSTVHLKKNDNYYFTPPASGRYWLRLDVNKSGKTYKFWNIRILGL